MNKIRKKFLSSYNSQDDTLRNGGKRRPFFIKSVIWLGIFILLIVILLLLTTKNSEAATITVDDDGGADFSKIQDAINISGDGDTVYVYDGTYYENIVINKTINLTGNNRETTVINGSGIGDVINVTADWVNITNFTIKGSGEESYDAGIGLWNVSGCKIMNNNISDNGACGIIIMHSNGNKIINNIGSRNCRGFLDGGPDVYLRYSNWNNITGNDDLEFSIMYSSHNYITDNNILGGITSIYMRYSDHNYVLRNNVRGGWHKGIYLNTCLYNNIINNTIIDCGIGIWLWDAGFNNILKNNISSIKYDVIYLREACKQNNITENTLTNCSKLSNYYYIRLVAITAEIPPSGNIIYHNNFIDKNAGGKLAIDDGIDNLWDYGGEGNYWSDYSGNDVNGDGIGDTPYEIDSDTQDNYPLIQPYNGSIPPDSKSPFFTSYPLITDRIVTLPYDNFQLVFTTSEQGHYEVIIDTGGEQGFDNTTDIVLRGKTTAEFQYITWNGKDAYNNNVEDGDYQIQVVIWDKAGNPISEPYDAGLVGIISDNDLDGIGDAEDLDDDNDYIPDEWEERYGLNSTNPQDADEDEDDDGYTNFEEYKAGTNPLDANSKPFSFADYFYYILFAVIFIPMLITIVVMKKLFKKSSLMEKEGEPIDEEGHINNGEQIEEEKHVEEDKNVEKEGHIEDAPEENILPKEEAPTNISDAEGLKDQPPPILETKIFCSNCRYPITLRDGNILPIECPSCKTMVQPPKLLD